MRICENHDDGRRICFETPQCHKEGLTATRQWRTFCSGGIPVKKLEIIKTTIRVPKPLWDDVRIEAIKQGTSAEDLVVRALCEHLKIKFDVRVSYEKPKKGAKS
jgi:hypothetical protein